MELTINQIFEQATNAHKEDRLQDAERLYHEVLKINPNVAEIYYNLAIAQNELNKDDEALMNYKKSIKLKPEFPEAYSNLGNLLYKLGRLDESQINIKKAIELKPDYAEAYNNLGNTMKGLGKLDEAEITYKKAIDLKPDYAEAYNNLGTILKDLNKLDDAEVNIKKAIELKPDYAVAYYNLGNALTKLVKLDEAELCIKKAIELKPNFAEAYNVLGNIFQQLLKLKKAETSHKKAIELRSNFADAYHNLGNTLRLLGKIDESLLSYNSANTLDPDIDFLLGSLLHTKMQLCVWDDLSSNLLELTKKINNNEKVISPFSLLSLIDDPNIHKKAAEINSNNNFPKLDVFPKILLYHNHKKIKIGYFSPDFRNHPVSYLIAELFEVHDRNKFEIHAFSFGQDTKDELNIRIKAGVDYFHDMQKMSNRDVVKLARSLEIDIAIDLAGLTRQSRQGIFSMSAAPIQVNYLGYPGTMGINYMDYLIADHTLIPNEKKIHYSEKIVFMPNSYQVNDSKTKVSKKGFTRKDFGLLDTGFVFCSFNNQYKINPTTFAGWMRILKATANSVLWVYVMSINAVKNLKKEAKKFGIDEDRLIFAQRISHIEHLERIKLADLFIDTLPFNAHTTASDALRMGLPVLTCIGNSFAGRVTASLLTAVNLSEMIMSTQEEYETLAIQLATHPEKLKVIKDKLVNNLLTAPLYNTSLYARNLEVAYQIMYKRYQDGLNPNDIEIDS